VVTAVASATVIALAAPAGAHEAKGPPDVSRDEASVELKSFPQTSTITFHIKVNGTDSTKTTQFSGPSGTASVSISDLTTATGTLAIEAYASWTIDGGGKSDTTKITEVCHEEPPTTGEPPSRSGASRPNATLPHRRRRPRPRPQSPSPPTRSSPGRRHEHAGGSRDRGLRRAARAVQ
jgi:hypothetical protein